MTDAMKNSADFLHFVAAIDMRRQLVSYVCELQPLAVIRSYGQKHPTRCPFCQQDVPIGTSLSMNKNEEKI